MGTVGPLTPLIALPLIGAALSLTATGDTRGRYALGTVATLITAAHSLLLLAGLDVTTGELQYRSHLLGGDGLSLTMCALTGILSPPILLASWRSVPSGRGNLVPLLLVTEAILMAAFTLTDLVGFYLAFELSLLPLLLLVGRYGGRYRRVGAAQSLVLYTLAGSLLTLVAILALISEAGGTGWELLIANPPSPERQAVILPLLLAGMMVKVPVVPIHLWLPEAHVEAPTAGSVLLAGVILKLGGYAILRWALPLCPEGANVIRPALVTIAALGVIYGSLAAMGQTDVKRVIAYSSVAHMNVGLLGMVSNTVAGVAGSILLMVSHGLVSSAMFLAAGVLYDRYGTRTVGYYRGLAVAMPLLTVTMLILTLASVALPGTASFPAELLTLLGSGISNPAVTAIAALSIVLGPCYALTLYHRMFHGALSSHIGHLFGDLTLREFHLLAPLVVLTLVLGVYPHPVIDWVTLPSLHLLTPLQGVRGIDTVLRCEESLPEEVHTHWRARICPSTLRYDPHVIG